VLWIICEFWCMKVVSVMNDVYKCCDWISTNIQMLFICAKYTFNECIITTCLWLCDVVFVLVGYKYSCWGALTVRFLEGGVESLLTPLFYFRETSRWLSALMCNTRVGVFVVDIFSWSWFWKTITLFCMDVDTLLCFMCSW
jgi:hypothetical protein